MEQQPLSKKEKKEQERLQYQQQLDKQKQQERLMKWGVGGLIGLIILGGLWWVIKSSSAPLPGNSVVDLGREHIPHEEWEKYHYNSNPPTSGSHDPVWTKPGIYDAPQGDGHLVHSLEHGYVIISYNCEKKLTVNSQLLIVGKAFAHEEEEASPSADQVQSGTKPTGEAWESSQCKDLVKKLSDLANEVRMWKMIVVPRPSLDVPLALTAWTRIDKLQNFDKERIMRFITAFRDKGPEKTME